MFEKWNWKGWANKTNTRKTLKIIFTSNHWITDACSWNICSEKKVREFIVRTFKNAMAVAVHCWYIKDAFAGFCQQNFEKKYFRGDLRENWQKPFVTLTIFCPLRGAGMWNWVNQLKKENCILNEVLKICEKWYLLILKML